ncbi:MAG: SBBP repeat-containing protein [Labilithrix sp.]|nr:SBBP repeat-containing protein [Labilithrix sp.]
MPVGCGGSDAVANGGDPGVDPSEVDAGNDASTPPGACAAGTWDDDANPSTPCVAWTSCTPGQRVATGGSATADRTCLACATGTFSATANADACGAWSECAAGTRLEAEGTTAADRSCKACATGTFSTTANASECTSWTACAVGENESAAGSTTSDRKCVVQPWMRQFGSTATDRVEAVSVDKSGNVVVVGYTNGALAGETSAGSTDAFVRKYDAAGTVLWTRQFGTSEADFAQSVSVDASGNVIVGGRTFGALPGQTSAGASDAFVRKYDAAGTVLWTRQFGTATNTSSEYVRSVTADKDGNVLVAGYVQGGTLPDQTGAGSTDAFVRKYDPDGNVEWTRQFGTTGSDFAQAVRADGNGNVVVAGRVIGALPGQMFEGGNGDAFVRKYDPAGAELWTRQFGTTALDGVNAASVDAMGNIVVAGSTEGGTLPGQTSAGGTDAFVRKYDAAGTELWTRQFGTDATDDAHALSIDAAGNIMVAGDTAGALPMQTSAGDVDAFVRKYSPAGAVLWTAQLGTTAADHGAGVAVDARGNPLVCGFVGGTLAGQMSAGGADGYVVKLVP